jgi:hypothetical protein
LDITLLLVEEEEEEDCSVSSGLRFLDIRFFQWFALQGDTDGTVAVARTAKTLF